MKASLVLDTPRTTPTSPLPRRGPSTLLDDGTWRGACVHSPVKHSALVDTNLHIFGGGGGGGVHEQFAHTYTVGYNEREFFGGYLTHI